MMRRNLSITTVTAILLTVPVMLSAAQGDWVPPGGPDTFSSLVNVMVYVIGSAIVPLIFALAFLVFLWGVFQYNFFPGDEKKLEQGRSMIIYGLVGLFVMFSVWGLVTIVQNTLFL